MSGERQTLRGSPVVAAPGKVFLLGEYAVLAGAPAVVAAVSRFAVGQYVIGFEPASPFVAEAVRSVLLEIGESAAAIPPGSVLIDSTSFSAGGKKLGLGSSAAVVVVAVGALLEMAGVAVEKNRELCFTLAQKAHRNAQGGVGSGADVAAAVHGGVIQYRRQRGGKGAGAGAGGEGAGAGGGGAAGGGVTTARLELPAGLRIVVFSEGRPASTRELVQTVDAFAERSPAEYAALMSTLEDHAETFIEAIAGGNLPAAIAVAQNYALGLAELGERSGAPIVTPRFELAAELAANLGGMAKPSGAGGGDIGIGLFADDVAARTFASRLDQLGLRVLDLEIDLNGVHRRRPASNL